MLKIGYLGSIMVRRTIVVLLLLLVSTAVTSLVSGAASLIAGNFESGGAREIFLIVSLGSLLVSVIVFCLLVLAMAVYLVEQFNKDLGQVFRRSSDSGEPSESRSTSDI